MKTICKNYQIATYGETYSEFREAFRGLSVSPKWKPVASRRGLAWDFLLVSSEQVDDEFVVNFREHATPSTRLLLLCDRSNSADSLLSRIVDLQIRTSQRFCIIDTKAHCSKTQDVQLVASLLKRLTSALESEEQQERILDARIEEGMLRVISQHFHRLTVPVTLIPGVTNAGDLSIRTFEIDDDGSFIYWPALDMHLGWTQLQQLVDPATALKALQRSEEFNRRYGKAVQKVREDAGLALSDITGISEKQLRRIESGECRLTSNAIEALARAYKISANEYMKRLEDALN